MSMKLRLPVSSLSELFLAAQLMPAPAQTSRLSPAEGNRGWLDEK